MPSSTPLWVAVLQGDGPGGFCLHVRERQVLSPRAVPKRKNDFLRGRMVGRGLACDVLGLDPQRIAIVPDERGVPWIEYDDARLAYSMSLSHTVGVAGAAIVKLPFRVGIDVERPIDRPAAVIRGYFDMHESEYCACGDAREVGRRASEIWALKEACLKVMGTGLRVPVSAVSVCSVGNREEENGWRCARVVLSEEHFGDGWETIAWLRWMGDVVVVVAVAGERWGAGEVALEVPRIIDTWTATAAHT